MNVTPIKVKDLQIGRIYYCLLSDRPVLIVSRETSSERFEDKDSKKQSLIIGIVFNPARGELEEYPLYDNALCYKDYLVDNSNLV